MGPLQGIRVLELGQLIAGPYCGQLFADFGAEVVKIEPPKGGDAMRQWGRTDQEGRPIWWSVIARNKKSLTLDLRQGEGQELLREMAASADERDVVIGANQDSVFRRLCETMGDAALVDDERFATHRARGDNAEALDGLIGDWTRGRDADAAVAALAEAGVPVGLVYCAPEMLEDPHFVARESVTRVHDERYGEFAMQNVFPRLSETPGEVRHAGPELGADPAELLEDWLGASAERLGGLRARGIV